MFKLMVEKIFTILPMITATWSLLRALTLCILMDFLIHIDAIRMGLPILYFQGLQEG